MTQTEAIFEQIPERIIAELQQAKHSIYVAVAWFTRADFFEILLAKAKAGVAVQVAVSNDHINHGAKINHDLLNQYANAQTWWVGDGDQNLMHHKFCVIDQKIVITGSFNWSVKAERNNHENITVSQDTMLARAFYQQFYRIINQPLPSNTEILPIAQIIKRLEILKNYVILEDVDDVDRESQKLRQFDSEQDIAGICQAIVSRQFAQAIGLIDRFINKYHSVAIYQDVDIMALKLEIRLLEHELNRYDSEKTELEKLLADFDYQYRDRLGDLIVEVLQLKKQIAKQNDDQMAFDEAMQDEKIFNEQLNEQKAKTHYELNDAEKKRLKQAYRKANQICHPDRVSDEQKEMAQAVFIELNQAYEENNLQKVEQILADLQQGVFKARSETLTAADKLQAVKKQLSQTVEQLKQTIAMIKNSESYHLICQLDDWDLHFDEQALGLKLERDRLKSLIFADLDKPPFGI